MKILFTYIMVATEFNGPTQYLVTFKVHQVHGGQIARYFKEGYGKTIGRFDEISKEDFEKMKEYSLNNSTLVVD